METSGVYLDPFILTEQQLLDIYNAAYQNLLAGKQLVSWTGEGTAANYEIKVSPLDLMREARTALKQKNPQRYGFIATTAKAIFY